MRKLGFFNKKGFQELLFQIVVSMTLFLFYSYNQDNSLGFSAYKLAFFLNYLISAMVINYILIPKLYSKGKVGWFTVALVAVIVFVIVIDEYVLEQIYFPTTRGTYFPGVLFTLLETLPLITAFVGLKFAWDYHRKQNEIESLKHLVREGELQFLKSQINPHFLFNNLNNLYIHAIDNSPQTPDIIIELSSVLRYMLYDCKEKYTALEKEISNLKHYTALNELQIGHRGIIRFEVSKIPEKYVIAPLILVVFVENAFKHSTASQSENIHIDIRITIADNGFLVFKCENSYQEYTYMDKLDKGIGLSNVKKRLALLYPNAHELHIRQSDSFYKIELSIQLKTKR